MREGAPPAGAEASRGALGGSAWRLFGNPDGSTRRLFSGSGASFLSATIPIVTDNILIVTDRIS